ncbi:tetratricopeptide repeat protein 24-like, partial [Micropterus dolomieu]|uniref:tetratricopeptide repeat protein 24-like n=1 Tax=Micropterus dolomieu TaxID=147949 RepID=UPI001E8EC6F1
SLSLCVQDWSLAVQVSGDLSLSLSLSPSLSLCVQDWPLAVQVSGDLSLSLSLSLCVQDWPLAVQVSGDLSLSLSLSLCVQDWPLAVQGFLRAAESYRLAAMLDSAAAALKEAGSHMIQSDQFSHNDIIGVLTECLSLTESITDPRILGELYLSVGVSYCHLRCFQDAARCFQLALGPAAQRPPLLAKVLHNLGAALNSVGQFTPAVGYHRLAAGLYGSLGCRGDQARCFSNLAFAFSQLGDEDEAAESFIHALQGFRDTEDHLAQVQVCESLAECYLKQRKQQKAVQLYKQALAALTHCKDSSGSVRDRLVERLTAALQQSLTVSPQV